MDRLPDLGKALARLRSIRGLSLEACAERIGMTIERLAEVEGGQLDLEALRSIAELYALDEDDLREGWVTPREGVEGATVFLLHGAFQDFDARDLGVLDRAMHAARSLTAISSLATGDTSSLTNRIQFVPTPPSGPRPRDAAWQGYKLARWVRSVLQLGGEPIDDIRALLEKEFGVAVVVDRFASQALRAASILDARRAAAAAVLSSDHPEREKNPTLARVYLAHELCHLLFDPGAPGSVRIALDDELHEGGCRSSQSDTNTLLESRAKGFAAEFLIPLEGLRSIYGQPTGSVSSLARARNMLAEVRERFGTPSEIATYHLKNVGYIQQEFTFDLLHDKPSLTALCQPTTLPEAGARPVLLDELMTMHAQVLEQRRPSPSEMFVIDAPILPDSPWYVDTAHRAASDAICAFASTAIARSLAAGQSGRDVEAADILVDLFDGLFLAGEFETAQWALGMVVPEELPPKALTAVLMVTSHAREELGQSRVAFYEAVLSALRSHWKVPKEALESIERRLR